MKSRSPFFAAVLFLFLVSSVPAQQQTRAVFAAGFPKGGTMPGTILVKGTTTYNQAWTPRSAQAIIWPKGGGPLVLPAPLLTLNQVNGDWGGANGDEIGGLTPGVQYNVMVQVTLGAGMLNQQVCTDPVVVIAKPAQQ